ERRARDRRRRRDDARGYLRVRRDRGWHPRTEPHDGQLAARVRRLRTARRTSGRRESESMSFDLGLNRDGGLTHVLDKGLGPRAWEDVLETSGDYISIVKLGWGTAYVTQNLERKLEVLKEKPVVLGGTFFEVVYVRGKFDEYKQWLTKLGLTHVEISDGTIDIPRERKLELIADFVRDFTVLSEV